MPKLRSVVTHDNNVVIMDENDVLVGVTYVVWSEKTKRFLITKHTNAYGLDRNETEKILRSMDPMPKYQN